MGSGIAMSSVLAGYPTLIYDVKSEALNKAIAYIHKQLEISVEKGKITSDQKSKALELLSTTEDKTASPPILSLRPF